MCLWLLTLTFGELVKGQRHIPDFSAVKILMHSLKNQNKMKIRLCVKCMIKMLGIVVAIVTAVSTVSCNAVFEDSEPCPQGLRLRFVYDYNMEDANAFPSQIDCLTLLVYDKNGNYVKTVEAGPSETSNEDWRMHIDLPSGEYNLLAYGGISCGEASFKFVESPSETRMNDLRVHIPSDLITSPKGTELHPLFYGAQNVTVSEEATDYTDATVNMMKDTNNLRIILQNVDGSPVDNEDFFFNVIADNTLLNFENDIIPTPSSVFFPWAQGVTVAGEDNEGNSIKVGYAEFSLSRLMVASSPRLEIKRRDSGLSVLSIPLISYLLLLKSEHYDYMKPQEFLDRESRWSIIFFLDGNQHWLSTQIIVNGWVVRINDIGNLN